MQEFLRDFEFLRGASVEVPIFITVLPFLCHKLNPCKVRRVAGRANHYNRLRQSNGTKLAGMNCLRQLLAREALPARHQEGCQRSSLVAVGHSLVRSSLQSRKWHSRRWFNSRSSATPSSLVCQVHFA